MTDNFVHDRIRWLQDRLAGWNLSSIQRRAYENELWRLLDEVEGALGEVDTNAA